MTDEIVKTWEEVAKLTPYSPETLRKKHGKDMLRVGAVFKDRLGKARTPTIWGYKLLIIKYFTILGQKKQNNIQDMNFSH